MAQPPPDLYVAPCGEHCDNFIQGIRHERHCPKCKLKNGLATAEDLEWLEEHKEE